MFEISVKNKQGQTLDFSGNEAYEIFKIDGLNPPPAKLNFSEMANFDGSKYNSAQLENRNLVLYVKIHSPIAENRINLYKYFPLKQKIRVFYSNEKRSVYIDGYVETVEIDLFTMNETAQISIVCPDPYWKEITTTELSFSHVTGAFEFPFSIPETGIPFSSIETADTVIVENDGVEKGMIVEFRATTDQILNPKIINRTTQKFFGMNFDLNEGDVIRINTQRGEKSVVLIRDGVQTNIINDMTPGSSWLQLISGCNEISYECAVGAENLNVYISVVKYYEGV